jgi:hypothetical protein
LLSSQSGTLKRFLNLGLCFLTQCIFSRLSLLFTLKLLTLEAGQSGLISALRFSGQPFVSQVSAKLLLAAAKSLGQGNEAWADHIATAALDAIEKMEVFKFNQSFRLHLIMEALWKKPLRAGIGAGPTPNAGLLDPV